MSETAGEPAASLAPSPAASPSALDRSDAIVPAASLAPSALDRSDAIVPAASLAPSALDRSDATPAVPVLVRRLDPDLPLPSYSHPGDAGADLVAAEDVEIPPGGRVLVGTGMAIALPPGHVGLVHPRSGLAVRLGVTVLNAPGTVDAGYRGEILVNLINHDRMTPARIARGDRIAQLVVQRVERAHFHVVEELPDSVRGDGGHGSTGGHAGLAGVMKEDR